MITTLDDFLDWEDEQLDRYEFFDGAVRRKTGGTEDLDRLSVTQIMLPRHRAARRALLGTCLQPQGGEPGEQRLDVPGAVRALRPRGGRRTWIEDAVVVVEVISPRTAKDDLTRKRRAYTSLATMWTVVYVSQDEARLDLVRRQADGSFADEVVEELDGVLELPEIGVRLSMAEIYEDTLIARTADRP